MRAPGRGFDNVRMPELPEVEVTRRSLAGSLEGAVLLQVWQGKALRWPLGIHPSVLAGRRIGALRRRGKYLWMPLEPASSSGEIRAETSPGLLLHLGMSGSLDLFPPDAVAPRRLHDHFEWITDRGVLRLHDPRRFGAVVWSASLDLPPAASLLAGLGLEPLEPGFTAARLRAGLAGRRVSVKQALLAGNVVVGVGNIYCSEALFAAGIDPRTPAHQVGPARCARLVEAVRQVLTRALESGGSTLRDFHDAQGRAGAFQEQAAVYGRAGQSCRRCGAQVQRIQQGQRSTYFCPGCQHR